MYQGIEVPPITLQNTGENLSSIVYFLSIISPDWEAIEATVRKTRLFQKKSLNVDSLQSLLFESHVHNICASLPTLSQVYAPEKVVTNRYVLSLADTTLKSINVRKKEGNHTTSLHTEYDQVLLVRAKDQAALPTLIEVTQAQVKNFGGQKNKNLDNDSLKKRLHPLVEFFQTTNFAYLLCVLHDMGWDSPRLKDFEKKGGRVIRSAIEKKKLREQAIRIFSATVFYSFK